MNHITLNVAQGVGDIFWIYQKFSPYYQTIDFNVLVTNDQCPVQGRSLGFLRLLPKVRHAKLLQVTHEKYQDVITTTYDQRRIMTENRGQPIDYACNRPLEEGTRLEDIDKGLDIEWEVPVNDHFASLPWKDYICLYVCGSNKSADVWSVEQWGHFVRRIYQKLGWHYPIAIIGAKYDESVMHPLIQYLHTYNINASLFIDSWPANVCYIIKNSLAFIGYQSGLSILADNYCTPQIMMYFNKLDKLRYSWPSQKNIDAGNYRPFFFKQTPFEAAEALSNFQAKKPKKQILFTCGLGDFFAIESVAPKADKDQVDHIFYATRQEQIIREMIDWRPDVFPNLKYQISLYDAFTGPDTTGFCVESKEQLKTLPLKIQGLNFDLIEDWSLTKIGDSVFEGKDFMANSSFAKADNCDVSKFNLPKKYVAIHPYSENARKDFRDLSVHEWDAILSYLERIGTMGVVINRGGWPAPNHRMIIDLTNKTTMPEALQIVSQSSAYIGSASCFSVTAAKVLPENKLFIKGHEAMKTRWYKVYYAPHDSNKFIYHDLSFLALHGPPL